MRLRRGLLACPGLVGRVPWACGACAGAGARVSRRVAYGALAVRLGAYGAHAGRLPDPHLLGCPTRAS